MGWIYNSYNMRYYLCVTVQTPFQVQLPLRTRNTVQWQLWVRRLLLQFWPTNYIVWQMTPLTVQRYRKTMTICQTRSMVPLSPYRRSTLISHLRNHLRGTCYTSSTYNNTYYIRYNLLVTYLLNTNSKTVHVCNLTNIF